MADQKIRETTNYQLYKLDQLFKTDTNLVKYIQEQQDFYNGKQYPNENYKNMLRVTLNICSFDANVKASKICGTPIYLTFTADDDKTDCTALRQFDEYNCNKLKMKSSNYQSALNGFVNGTEIVYTRWDDDDTTYKGIYKGGLKEEHIDPRNFAVANPYIDDIQNQQWVMFWDDVPVAALKDILEVRKGENKEEKLTMLEREGSHGSEDEFKDKDKINHALCRMFTRFFRVKGEVYFTCETETVELFAYPHPLSRKVGKKVIKDVVDEYLKNRDKDTDNQDLVKDFNIDYEDLIIQSTSKDTLSDKEYKNVKEQFSLYPFAVFIPFKQNRSFYGRSEIKSLIPIQKGINFMISMLMKCSENNAYNKIIVKPEALQGQTITNEPGQVLTDYSQFTNGWGIKFAETQPMPNGLLDFVDRLVGITRVVYGFNDVMNGDISNQDMSGYMLQQMIKQANTTIEQQQELFWEFNVDKAAIRLLYYKHYVDVAKYTFEYSESDYEGEEQARQQLFEKTQKGHLETLPNAKPEDFATPVQKVQVKEIKNKDIYGVNFDISIEAMQGLSDSKLVEQQMWDNLLLNGGINNISPDILSLYLQASPNVSPRTKTALKNVVENLKNSKIQQLQGQLQELAQKTQQVMAYAQQLEKQNNYKNEYLKNLQKEFSSKIKNQNNLIDAMSKDMQNMSTIPNDKSMGEVKSDNARGISGDKISA